jgi:hypothetical protein
LGNQSFFDFPHRIEIELIIVQEARASLTAEYLIHLASGDGAANYRDDHSNIRFGRFAPCVGRVSLACSAGKWLELREDACE